MKSFSIHILAIFVLAGCSSQKVTQPSEKAANPARSYSPEQTRDTLSRLEIASSSFDSSFFSDSNYDAFLTHYLEAARQHYVSALDARESGDTIKCGSEFEHALADLDEISNFPGIDSSQEFTDLSRSVLEDYEKYIASIDSLGPESSIFALREKLDQMSDSTSTAAKDKTQKIITTTTIPLVINGYVEQNLEFFTTRFRPHFGQWLERTGKYFPRMRRIFKEEGVPDELIFLCMIESGVNPEAQSWVKAVGMWQFMKGTGTLYGLKSNFWYDERRDYEKSARAAARLLKALYADYGDWYLVLAAYNSGGGRVNRAIRRSGSHDFWKMRPYLPRQTRNYVPEYIAATVIALDPKSYGFDVTPADSLTYDVVTINDCVDLSVLAECAETDVNILHEFNPSILRWCTPPGSKEFTLRIPTGKARTFAEKYAQVPEGKKHNQLTHTVRKRETLASIANKYGISVRLLAEANRIRPRSKVPKGTILMIPVPSPSKVYNQGVVRESPTAKSLASGKTKRQDGTIAGKQKVLYRIKRGDTLGDIAKRFGVRVSDLRVWNDIACGTKIVAGEELSVWVRSSQPPVALVSKSADSSRSPAIDRGAGTKVASSKAATAENWITIRVRSGDNLRKLAKRYGVSVGDISRWNHMEDDIIREGQRLSICQKGTSADATKTPLVAKTDTSGSGQLKSYTVKKGDTLFAIAALFGVSVENLRAWNRIKGHRIKVGQEIKIDS